uniref:Uncharacterized protein n=1 Tax=Lotharella oceanica TaxID=641309 RepID=A0A7S2TT80_9EUKA|mmetsp:Transcript_28465/g.53348  ORF Transcript_28465/g.53348 Transcript_28465/m.53348 type:complete len:308 (+) Transcript_28465:52-975(+)
MGARLSSSELNRAYDDTKDTASRLLIVHFRQAKHRLKVFPGTPKGELESAIRALLELDDGDNDETRKLVYVDREGDPVALSSHFPNGYEIHVSVKKALVFPKAVSTAGGDWRQWARIDEHVKSDRVWEVSSSDYGTRAMSGRLSGKGKHYAVLNLSQTPCCISVGFVPADTHPRRLGGHNVMEHMVHAMSMVLGPKYFKSSTTAGATLSSPMRMGVLADMDNKEVMMFPLAPRKDGAIVDELKGTTVARIGGLPPQVRFAISHPKHGLNAEFEAPGATQPPVFTTLPPLLKKEKDGKWTYGGKKCKC